MPAYIVTSLVCLSASIFVVGGLSLLFLTAARGSDVDRRTAIFLICGLFTWAAIAVSVAYWRELNFTVFLPFALLPILIGTLISFHPRVTNLLSSIPVHGMVFLQTYRVAGFIFVYLYFTTGELSRGFAMNAGWGDVLTGVLALPVGWMLWKRIPSAGLALIFWSLIGIGDLILAPASAKIYGAENLVTFPLNTIPLFLGPPLGILLHILTLRIFYLSRPKQKIINQQVTLGELP